MPHEGGGADRAVVGARHRVADAGVDAVEPITGRNFDVPFDRPGLAAELEQSVFPAAGARHLVHDAARRSDDLVLDALAQRRQFYWADHDIATRRDGSRTCDFERSRGRDTAPLGD